jgi:hypothetical protein
MELFSDPIFSEIRQHILRQFIKYHQENPHIYDLFKKFASEARASGRQRFGVGMISERVRWYVDIETRGDAFKINNNYRSCYVRMMILEDPGYETFFKRREHLS